MIQVNEPHKKLLMALEFAAELLTLAELPVSELRQKSEPLIRSITIWYLSHAMQF